MFPSLENVRVWRAWGGHKSGIVLVSGCRGVMGAVVTGERLSSASVKRALCNVIVGRIIKWFFKTQGGPSKLHSCWSKSCSGSHSLCTLWTGGILPTMHITQSSVIIFNQNGINNFLSDEDRHARALVKIVAGSSKLFTPFSSNQNLHLAHLSWRHLASLALPQFRNLQNCKIASQDELNCTQLFCCNVAAKLVQYQQCLCRYRKT